MYTNELKTTIINTLLSTDHTTTNKWIYRQSYIRSHNLTDIIQEVAQLTSFVVSQRLDERIYCILNDVSALPRCYCGTVVKFKQYGKGYARYCSVKCRANDKEWQRAVSDTNLANLGVTHVAQLPHERLARSNRMKIARPLMDMTNASQRRSLTIRKLYGQQNTGWLSKAIETRVSRGSMVPLELRDEYRDYYALVSRITAKQPLDTLDNIERRGVLGKDPNAHHIDHIFTIYDGFMNDVPPEVIGHISNLQCIPGAVNITKGNKSTIDLTELYERHKAWKH